MTTSLRLASTVVLAVMTALYTIGCASAETTSRFTTNQAMVSGTTETTIGKVVQWCTMYRYEVINNGDEFLVARIKNFRWQNGEFVFDGNCGVPSWESPDWSLMDPRMKVYVEQASGRTDMSVVTVILNGRSEFGDCRSSGIVEQKLFEYLDAQPIPPAENGTPTPEG